MIISIFLTLLVIALLTFLAMMPGRERREELLVMRTSYAHRGLHNAAQPENSLSAFAAAIEAGYGIEFDVRLTADKVPVVFHDETLARVCGCTGAISAMPYHALRQLRLGQSHEGIPSLAEVLRQVDGQVPLLIEVKGDGIDPEICVQMAQLLDNYDGVFSIQSFNPLYLSWFRAHRPGYIRGLLYTNLFKDNIPLCWWKKTALSLMLLNFLVRPDFIAYNRAHPTELPLLLCRNLFAAPCLCWTIHSEAEANATPAGTAIIFEGFTPDR